MQGYRIYYNYNNKMFENETETTEVRNDKNNTDSDVSWIDTLTHAEKAVKYLNEKLKNGNMLVKKCRDCNKTFCIDKEEIEWLGEKGLKPYTRCYSCRKRKKDKK